MKSNPLFLYPLIIFLVAALQYINTIPHDFSWDDKLVITENEYTRQGITGLRAIFTKRVSVPDKNVYRPIPQALFALEFDLSKHDPHVLHLFNMIWYAIACVIVFYFIQFVFPPFHSVFPFISALLFTVHPLHVEVVANIKSRDELLAFLFGLLAVVLLIKAVEMRKWRVGLLAVVCYTLAILSKQNAITLLPVAVLVFWCRQKSDWTNQNVHWLIAAGFLLAGFTLQNIVLIAIASAWVAVISVTRQKWVIGLAIAGIIIAVYLLSLKLVLAEDVATVQSTSTVLNNIFLWTKEPGKVLPTALVNIARYIGLFLYPHPLIHLYGYNQIPLYGWHEVEPWAVLVAIALCAWLLLKTWRQKRPILFGVLFFAVTYSIYSNLIVLAPDTMADRYLFMPSLGLTLIATDLLFWLGGIDFFNPDFRKARPRGALLLFGLVLVGYFARTWIGNRDWENDQTLIFNRIAYMENNAAAQATYGFVLYQNSQTATTDQEQRLLRSKSMQAFIRAVEIYPDFYLAWISIGKLFAEEGMNDKAELSFMKAQRLAPYSPGSYFCLGSLYYALQDGELAATYLEKSVLLEPKSEQSYVMLGKVYLQLNNLPNLRALAETGIRWFPHNAEFDALLASFFFKSGQYWKAKGSATSALRKDPQNLTALTLFSSPMLQAQGDSTTTFVTPAP
jgi:cytochrome c-type biogenesis protein CcmH/NrfG